MNRILSIDGGGSRGIVPATILDNIFRDTGKYPTELFDVFAGTSTGGIITLALSVGIPTDEIVDLYFAKAGHIFQDSFFDNLLDVSYLFGAKYSNDNLKAIAKEFFGEQTLGQINAKFKGEKIFMVPSFNLYPAKEKGRNENFRPVVYNSAYLKHSDERLLDVALRTSAAPTYLPIYQKQFIDGGVAINHPALSAISFAVSNSVSRKNFYRSDAPSRKGLGLKLETIRAFSLGCGTSNGSFVNPDDVSSGDWGIWQWRAHFANLMTESNVQCTEYYVQQLLREENYMRIQLDFSDKNMPDALRGKPVDLDVTDIEKLQHLQDAANNYYNENKKDIINWLMNKNED